ncbi:hypothetical protein B0H16DRAFT_1214566, partial [Mycena metata]
QTLSVSPYLNAHLQMCFILAFDLMRRPRSDESFMARVDIGVEPTDILQFLSIYSGQPTGGKVPGMVQLNVFTPLRNDFLGDAGLTAWRNTRLSLDGEPQAGRPVGTVIVSKANALYSAIQIVIMEPAFDVLRGSPTFTQISGLTGKSTQKPVDIGSCLEIMNKHIHADSKNQLSLRMEMTPGDIQVIR